MQKHIPIYLLVVNRCYCWCKSIYPTHLKIFFGMALYRYSRGRRQVCYPYHYHHDKYIVATITASMLSLPSMLSLQSWHVTKCYHHGKYVIITITIMTRMLLLLSWSWQVCHRYHYHQEEPTAKGRLTGSGTNLGLSRLYLLDCDGSWLLLLQLSWQRTCSPPPVPSLCSSCSGCACCRTSLKPVHREPNRTTNYYWHRYTKHCF